MITAPTVKNPQATQQNQQRAVMPIPFTRAARRKSIQGYNRTYTLSAGATVPVEPIELPPAGFVRDIEMLITVSSTGNAAAVALGAGGDAPWNVINSLQVTNAAGDTIYVPINGYQLYLINKYGGMYPAWNSDPRNDPAFVAPTTGAGATAGSFTFLLRIPFELDPRDGFCALPNLAANKAYQVLINLASLSTIFAGGTAPNGTVTCNITMVMNYWSQPNAVNGEGYPQETAPGGVGSVSLWRYQTVNTTGGGNRVDQLYNVGNVIRMGILSLYNNGGTSIRSDAAWPAISYVRLNNDQLFYKPQTFWLSEMRQRYGLGATAGTKDTASNLDTGVYVLSDFMAQHGDVQVDGPRDQYLVTLDSTLLQFEAANYSAAAQTLNVLTNEIKPISASALYSLNVV
jgi:hypothetical protein